MPHNDQSAPNTRELVERAKLAPSEGFAALYQRVAPALVVWTRIHIRQNLRSRLDPEDVLQETAMRAWQRFDSYDPLRANFRAWIFGIARNVLFEAIGQLSHATKAASPLTTSSLGALPDDATSITRAASRREQLSSFAAHVDSLEREDQRLLLYRGLEERTHEEVGKLLNTSAETAAKRWQRLRDRLVAEVGGEDFLAA